MILCTRVEARDFKMQLSRCVSGRPRGPAPFLVIRFGTGRRTIASTTTDGVMLTHTSTADGEREEILVVPGSILAEIEGGTSEEVKLERQSKLRGVMYWHGGGKPRKLPVELAMPGKQHELSEPPVLSSVSANILLALQECGRSTAKDNGRYALSRIQIQGKAGRVVGTDGKVALLWNGFKFPFQDDVLVPALAVFGSKPLAGLEVRVGRTATHLVVAAGPWAIWLPTESKARYPDVAGVMPKHAPTVVGIEQQDAVELLRRLPTLPGNGDENRPVTIDANARVTIRGRDPDTAETKDVLLARSSSAGPPACVALDRRILARAVSLGCHTFRLTPDKPFIAVGGDITFIAAPLDPALIVPSAVRSRKITTDGVITLPHSNPPEERSSTMKSPETNGQQVAREDPQDPLIAAEELRASLADLATKAAKLVMALKAGRKEKKVLASVFAGLK